MKKYWLIKKQYAFYSYDSLDFDIFILKIKLEFPVSVQF